MHFASARASDLFEAQSGLFALRLSGPFVMQMSHERRSMESRQKRAKAGERT
jgi:hypothetical protein